MTRDRTRSLAGVALVVGGLSLAIAFLAALGWATPSGLMAIGDGLVMAGGVGFVVIGGVVIRELLSGGAGGTEGPGRPGPDDPSPPGPPELPSEDFDREVEALLSTRLPDGVARDEAPRGAHLRWRHRA